MKKALILFLAAVLLGLAGSFIIIGSIKTPTLDTAAVNDAVMTALSSDDRTEAANLVNQQLQMEYESIGAATRNRDMMLRIFLFVYTGIIAAAGVLLYCYCRRNVLAPFRKLKQFARNVAMGDLDVPLEMDRQGSFGAFTESFDIMREELKKARENEYAADRSKKELVASLSHDIKTPVASIKATTELMLVSVKDDKERAQLERIESKAEQINTLITNMFHATLEELQALSVTVAEVHSTAIPRLIENADQKGFVRPYNIPSCIVLADVVLLQQIFDNVIGNSYKYAGTDIDIHADFDGPFLGVVIEDHGPGAPDDELPLLANKFYRGNNAREKSGYGLGLFISKTLLEDMSGDLSFENRPGGFAVRIRLRLAGRG